MAGIIQTPCGKGVCGWFAGKAAPQILNVVEHHFVNFVIHRGILLKKFSYSISNLLHLDSFLLLLQNLGQSDGVCGFIDFIASPVVGLGDLLV